MDTSNKNILKQASIQILKDYRDFIGNDPHSEFQLIVDTMGGHYLLVEIGWDGNERVYGTLVHLDVINEKIWIQQDGTEEGVANELLNLGISPQQIVLAYKKIERRKITEFAVS